MHQFLKFIFAIKLYMFRIVPLFIIRSFSLYTQQWYMSYRFADSLLSALKIQLCLKVRQYQIASTEGMLCRRTKQWRGAASPFAMQQRLRPFSDEVSNDTDDKNTIWSCQNFEGSAATIVRVKHSLTLNTISSKFVRNVGISLLDDVTTSWEYQNTFRQTSVQCLATRQSLRIASCAEAYKQKFIRVYTTLKRARGGAISWRTALQAGGSRVRFPKVL